MINKTESKRTRGRTAGKLRVLTFGYITSLYNLYTRYPNIVIFILCKGLYKSQKSNNPKQSGQGRCHPPNLIQTLHWRVSVLKWRSC